jgi:hypothetical protein
MQLRNRDVRAGGNMRRAISVSALLMVMIFQMTPVLADKEYPATLINPSRSPLALTSCKAWARDWNKTVLVAHAAIGDYLFDVGIVFRNDSSKPVTGLVLRIMSYDSSNAQISTTFLDTKNNSAATSMFVAPGTSFNLLGPKSWHQHNDPIRDHVSCEITAVRFADGTSWSAPVDK